ncbi:hypothetical protein [Komagataeibacter diospyri]|uniref:Uncharacterized protein n=1 Tax=Komagataeibacter diospyri TaxID=1932662 RepID=A0A4P5NNT8_9PROT|nr:hypothetical protein [Komagataeibacter diospyri]GCE83053.1 hypothetical protein MSKU9_1194 [Komagataeibacter diospyri]
MSPTHHVHISVGFMFVCLLFIAIIVALFVWLSWSNRRAKLIKMQIEQRHEEQMEQIRRGHDDQIARRVMDSTTRAPSVPRMSAQPASPSLRPAASSGYGSVNTGSNPGAPVIVHTGASRGSDNGFLEGALLGGIAGSMMGGRDHDTIIERDVSAPAAPTPDPFAGSGNDAGSSGGGFDYSSGGGGSSGGFDCGGSSGGSDGGGCDF